MNIYTFVNCYLCLDLKKDAININYGNIYSLSLNPESIIKSLYPI